jgi:predicted Rossmann fold nucleotide-binding protein DprA/Smf involved in DNA uptake
MIYAGIGSRRTPVTILKQFTKLGMLLGKAGYTLRSGHAPGADISFENGCDQVKGKKEIYIP